MENHRHLIAEAIRDLYPNLKNISDFQYFRETHPRWIYEIKDYFEKNNHDRPSAVEIIEWAETVTFKSKKFGSRRTKIYDERGFNNFRIHKNGTFFDDDGFDIDKIHKDTATRFTPPPDERDIDGYDKNGYDKKGFDKNQTHKDTGTKFGPDRYDIEGYDLDGFNEKGYNRFGKHRSEFLKNNEEKQKLHDDLKNC